VSREITPAEAERLKREAISYLLEKYHGLAAWIGWIMIASIFVDAWDWYAITLFGVPIEHALHTTPFWFGFAAAATQGGAIIGALTGGPVADKIGRRASFLMTVLIMTVIAAAQAFATNIYQLVTLRWILGYPLGMDIAIGYSYIMEYMPIGWREVQGNRWQIAFGAGDILSALISLALILWLVPPELAWRIVLGLGGLWAFIIFLFRTKVPESVIWLVAQGKFKDAKELAKRIMNDELAMLPPVNVQFKPKLRAFIADLRKDRIKWRTATFGWLSNWCQAAEAAPFGLLIGYFLSYFHITTFVGAAMWTSVFYAFGLFAGIIWPHFLPKLGHRKFQIIGFSLALLANAIGLYAVVAKNYAILLGELPFLGFALFTPSQSGMTLSSMTPSPEYKGTASGFAYQFVKWPYFVGYTIIPALMAMVGPSFNPAFAIVWSIVGLLGAIFLLPKELKFGYKEV